MKGIGQHFKNPLSLILASLVVLVLLGVFHYAKETPGLDYYVAWVAADAVNNDTPHNIYDSSSRYTLAVLYRNKADALENAPRQKLIAAYRGGQLHMTATPFLYWVTGLLSTGDYEKDLTLWHLISLVLLTSSILLICRLLNYPLATSLAILLPVLIWFSPLQSDLRVGNVNSFQLGLIGLILWLQSRQANSKYLFAAGLMIGLLVMFKPNLGPVALMFGGGWLVRRQFLKLGIAIGGMATGAASAVLVSSLWMGSATAWLDWFNLIRILMGHGLSKSGGNYATITEVTSTISPPGQLATAVILSLLCLAFFWWGRRGISVATAGPDNNNREFVEDALLVATGCIITMLASTVVWFHYYLLIIPMLLIALRPWQEPGPMKIIPTLMLRVLPVMALIVLMELAVPAIFGGDEDRFRSASTIISVSTLLLVGLWQLGYGIRAQPDPKVVEAPDAH